MERVEASFHVSVLEWPEVSRDVERAFLRFGLTGRSLRAKWRGLQVRMTVSGEGAPAGVHAAARFLEDAAWGGLELRTAQAPSVP